MDFITGNKFKNLCNYFLDGFELTMIREPKNNETPKYFLNVEHVEFFFSSLKPNFNYIIITHNGDNRVHNGFVKYLSDPFLVKWYGQNVDVIHPKLQSIPIGIANEIWAHGDTVILNKVIDENNKKTNLIYSNFSINTNFEERINCLRQITDKGIKMSENKNFEDYLRELSKSLFNISPNGNGIDCHKIWESLYLKTIPIVTKSINIDFYKNLPILVINNWSELNVGILTEETYHKIWGNFDPKLIKTDFFIK
jgi:hypothetical protein